MVFLLNLIKSVCLFQVGLFLCCSIILRAQTNTYQMRQLLAHTKALLGSSTLKLF